MSDATHPGTLLDRYQDYRTRRFVKRERKYANSLPGWRNQRRRRMLVVGLSVTFAFMFAVSILCAFGLWYGGRCCGCPHARRSSRCG